MSKKVLLCVAAVALLAMTAFAGDYKYEDWPTGSYTYTKTHSATEEVRALVLTIPVWIHIPYYVIIEPQDCRIDLEQVGQEGAERFHFAGTAQCRDGDGNYTVLPVIHTNFDATLSTDVSVTTDGHALEGHEPDSVWSSTVTPSAITAGSPAALTITCDVTHVDLLAFVQCNNLHVADVLLYIMHN